MTQEVIYLSFIVIALVFMLFFVNIVRDSQRITTRLLGRLTVIKGPGIVYRIPGLHQDWKRHSVGDRGNMKNEQVGVFQGEELPIIVGSDMGGSSTIRIKGFEGMGPETRFIVGPYS